MQLKRSKANCVKSWIRSPKPFQAQSNLDKHGRLGIPLYNLQSEHNIHLGLLKLDNCKLCIDPDLDLDQTK